MHRTPEPSGAGVLAFAGHPFGGYESFSYKLA